LDTEQGIIEKTMGKKAIVTVRQRSACASCGSRGDCEISGNQAHIEVLNDINAKAGDQVEISIPEGTILKLSLLVYFLPIIGLLIGAFAGDAIAEKLQIEVTIPAILGGVVVMGATFFFLRRLDRSSDQSKKYQPRVKRIITGNSKI
jgi:sigma-E factor negative regulatory protein RseC